MIQQKGMITVRLKEYKQRKFRRLMIQQKGTIAERPAENMGCSSMCIKSYWCYWIAVMAAPWRLPVTDFEVANMVNGGQNPTIFRHTLP